MKPFSVKIRWTEKGYYLLEDVFIFSERYGKWLVGYEGDFYDGATCAVDLCPEAFVPHDIICRDTVWSSSPKEKVSNWQASRVYCDQLKKHGFPIQARARLVATFLGGGKKLRKFKSGQ